MARSTVVTVTGTAQDVTIDAGDYIEIQPLSTVADGSLSVRGDATAVSEADECDNMALVAGAIMYVSRPRDGVLSAISSDSCKVSFRSIDA